MNALERYESRSMKRTEYAALLSGVRKALHTTRHKPSLSIIEALLWSHSTRRPSAYRWHTYEREYRFLFGYRRYLINLSHSNC